MNFQSLSIINLSAPDGGNFLVSIIKWLMQISGSIALGVILFTVLLKLITLPFDFWSKASMRKNSLRMEEMRPELERLQKQYANDKQLYNQKMMALYKRNGYSMFGACLPTIVTLVIFIVAINAFTDFSRYQNSMYFYNMSKSYNSVVYSGIEIDNDYVKIGEDGSLVLDYNKLITDNSDYKGGSKEYSIISSNGESQIKYNVELKSIPAVGETLEQKYFVLSSSNGYVDIIKYYENDTNFDGSINYKLNTIDLTNTIFNTQFADYISNNPYLVDSASEKSVYAENYVKELQRKYAADEFRSQPKSFLWIKNIWVTDSPLSHPVSTNATTLNTASCNCSCSSTQYISNDSYTELITDLKDELNAPNGYFILCVLSAVVSLLMQLVSNKSQKAQMELQTVDGQGASQQKMMMWMMPIMMAIFSFIYTAAFSIYIIISSLIGILTTLGINKIIDTKFKKASQNGPKQFVRGRVHDEEPKKVVKKEKKVEPQTGDFITGPVKRKK